MKIQLKDKNWRFIGEVASMYQIRKYNKIKKGAITMIDRLDKFPEPYDAVQVKDTRSGRMVNYLFIDREHGFRRIRSWVKKSIF